MKTLNNLALSLTLLIVLSGVGCKTRQYEKTAVSTQSSTTTTAKKDSAASTSKVTQDTSKSQKVSTITSTDSTTSETTFTPLPGSKTVIHPDGTIEGQFTNIAKHEKKHIAKTKRDTTTKQSHINSTQVTNTHVATDVKQEIKAKRDSTFKKGSSDSTLAANIPTWLWIVILVVILGVIAYIIIRIKAAKSLIP